MTDLGWPAQTPLSVEPVASARLGWPPDNYDQDVDRITHDVGDATPGFSDVSRETSATASEPVELSIGTPPSTGAEVPADVASEQVSRETSELSADEPAGQSAGPGPTSPDPSDRAVEAEPHEAAYVEVDAADGTGQVLSSWEPPVSRETSLPITHVEPLGADRHRHDDDENDDDDDEAVVDAGRAGSPVRTTAFLDVPAGTWPRPRSRRVMAIANQKGGVGKTTSTVNLAAALALHGVRVLVVDLDPQGNASTAFSVSHQANTPSIYDVLIGRQTLAEVAVPVDGIANLWCAPATIDLAGAEIELVSVVARESRLRRALDSVPDVDYVFIDCPPSLGLLTLNAMVAASEIMIPIQCEFYALEGLSQLLSNVELVKQHLNADLFVSTILLTMYDARTRLAEQVAQEVRTHFGELVLDSVIPRSVRISEAPGFGQTVVTFDPASRGAKAYSGAAYDLAQRAAPLEIPDEGSPA